MTLQLPDSVEALDVARVVDSVGPTWRSLLGNVDYRIEHESTNRALLDAAPPTPGRMDAALAEYQTAGRGRHGRRWTMPPGSGIALSAAWVFASQPEALNALSLAAGAAVRRAILDVTGIAVELKWPNDLLLEGGKLGGILVELAARQDGAVHVVIGVGINVDVPAAELAQASNYAAGARDLKGAGWTPTDRSALAGAVLGQFAELFAGFASAGFEPYREEWLAAHALNGRQVELQSHGQTDSGRVVGIEADGALILETAAGSQRRVVSGEVSIRAE